MVLQKTRSKKLKEWIRKNDVLEKDLLLASSVAAYCWVSSSEKFNNIRFTKNEPTHKTSYETKTESA